MIPGKYSANGGIYIRIPIWGRVQLANITGDLVNGLEIKINGKVASGDIRLFTQKNVGNGKQDLHAEIKLTAKFLGKFDDTVKILTIPCVFFFQIRISYCE